MKDIPITHKVLIGIALFFSWVGLTFRFPKIQLPKPKVPRQGAPKIEGRIVPQTENCLIEKPRCTKVKRDVFNFDRMIKGGIVIFFVGMGAFFICSYDITVPFVPFAILIFFWFSIGVALVTQNTTNRQREVS